jgi:hypothetical protein
MITKEELFELEFKKKEDGFELGDRIRITQEVKWWRLSIGSEDNNWYMVSTIAQIKQILKLN